MDLRWSSTETLELANNPPQLASIGRLTGGGDLRKSLLLQHLRPKVSQSFS